MLFMMMFACADKTADTGIQEKEYEYYTASTTLTLAESGIEFEEEYLVRRTLDPSIDEIFEEFYSTIDGTLITVTLDVDTDSKTFSLSFSDASYSGEGSFEGEGLHWDVWKSRSNHTDGSYVLSVDQKDTSGIIGTQKWGYSTTDTYDWGLIEILRPISEATFQSELEQLTQ